MSLLHNWITAGHDLLGNVQGHETIKDGTFVRFRVPAPKDETLKLKEGDTVRVAQGEFTLGKRLA